MNQAISLRGTRGKVGGLEDHPWPGWGLPSFPVAEKLSHCPSRLSGLARLASLPLTGTGVLGGQEGPSPKSAGSGATAPGSARLSHHRGVNVSEIFNTKIWGSYL